MSLRIGVAGLGYWGPNLARNFAGLPGCELAWCCDASEASRERWAPSFPDTRYIWSPSIGNREPLWLECERFARCLLDGATPRSDGHSELRVVRVPEGLQESLDASRRDQDGAV